MVERQAPLDWKIGVILLIHAKADNTQCKNYSGLTLLDVALKLYEKILDKRLRMYIEQQLKEVQSDFKTGRGIQNQMLVLKQLIVKTYRQYKELYLVFEDLKTSFDRVVHIKMWKSLKNRKVPSLMKAAIRSIYKKTTTI